MLCFLDGLQLGGRMKGLARTLRGPKMFLKEKAREVKSSVHCFASLSCKL